MSALHDPQIISHAARPTAVVRGTVAATALRDFFDRSFGQVWTAMDRQGAKPAGPAFAYYPAPPGEQVELEVGFLAADAVADDGDVVASELPAGEVARATHAGAYDALGDSWGALMAWVQEQGRAPAGGMWEVYVTEPTPETDPATLRTELYLLLA